MNNVGFNLNFDINSVYFKKEYIYFAMSKTNFSIREFRITNKFNSALYIRIVYTDNNPLKQDIVLKINWKKL